VSPRRSSASAAFRSRSFSVCSVWRSRASSWNAGLNKIASWELTVQLFADEYKVPVLPSEMAARMAATFEIGCSLLLIAGLATRLATLPLLGMIMTIQLFVYPSAYAEHLTWASILVFLLTRGAGPWSLDRLVGLEPGGSDRA
jgi:putative oxidoreductase